MNNKEAKKILALFRPGTSDQTDASFNDALKQAKPFQPQGRWQEKPDPELSQWFQAHCSSYLSVKNKFDAIPVPAGLKAQILAEYKPAPEPVRVQFRPPIWMAAAAVLALCLSVGVFMVKSHSRDDDFETYRNRMARTAMQSYNMNLRSHDLHEIHSFLNGRKAPADYTLPDAVAKALPEGCAVLAWQGQPVSMLCFKSGRPLRAGESTDLWLFVVDQTSLRQGPTSFAPELGHVMRLTTATWTREGKTYILAADGDEAFLRQYL